MVQNALRSVLKANEHYKDWELAFIDDSSPTPGKPICEQILSNHLDKTKFYHTEMTVQEKLKTGGMVGRYMNRAIDDSDADIAIMLCDDDELHPEYLKNINEWFENNKDDACFSHVIPYNPIFELSDYAPPSDCEFNHIGRVLPFAQLDASQVAWRISCGAKFLENKTKFLDADFYRNFGTIPFSGFIGQYKGIHISRLVNWECDEVWNGRTIDVPNGEVLTSVAEIFAIIEKYLDHGMTEEAARICDKGISLHPHETTFYKYLSVIHQ